MKITQNMRYNVFLAVSPFQFSNEINGIFGEVEYLFYIGNEGASLECEGDDGISWMQALRYVARRGNGFAPQPS